ncbi:MAG: hypothetical protein K9N23_14285 [Akkermansiaceae bacterium]|nr:hypothetical protein [Akkermansiaceae bacterium]
MPDSDAWPDDSKVRLEVEGAYQLDTSLPVRSADWFENLRTRLAQGRFAYGAAFGNNAHSNWGAEELARSTYYAERFFKDKTGVESTKNVIMRDEPSLSWGVIDALVEAGAKTLDSLRRQVVLYDSLPRIDIVNDAVKGPQIANVEIGYFAFPLKLDNFMLRHEMPTGDMRPGVNPDINDPAAEQYFTSSTAFYTVNRWVDASNQRDRGITFASLQAPLLSYGKPDIGSSKGGWNVNYVPEKPWIYSIAFNNEWQTNFQKTQPGRATFRYSLQGHAGGSWQAGNAQTFGAETSSPFRTSVISAAQPGQGINAAKGQFIGVNQPNVVLTTAKLAEANGEGIILRFNEIKGQVTDVKAELSWLAPAAVMETDLVENNKEPVALDGTRIAFTIPPLRLQDLPPDPRHSLTARHRSDRRL